jgi:hypothetical protein
MKKNELIKRFSGGIGVNSDERDYLNVNWLLDKDETSDDVLKLISYDANMYPLPDLSKWSSKEWRRENIYTCLDALKDFDIEVWLDDIKIKDKSELLKGVE